MSHTQIRMMDRCSFLSRALGRKRLLNGRTSNDIEKKSPKPTFTIGTDLSTAEALRAVTISRVARWID